MNRSYSNYHTVSSAPLRKWKEDAARKAEAEAEAREHRTDAEQRAVETQQVMLLRSEVAALRNEIADVRAEIDRKHEISIEATGTALGEFHNKALDHVDAAIQKTQNRLFSTIERRFGELRGHLDALAPDARSRAKDEFKFANERPERDDEPVELPNPLPSRRAIN